MTATYAGFEHSRLPELMQWFPDAGSCAVWGGPQFRGPSTPASFRADARIGELPSRMLIDDVDCSMVAFGQFYRRVGFEDAPYPEALSVSEPVRYMVAGGAAAPGRSHRVGVYPIENDSQLQYCSGMDSIRSVAPDSATGTPRFSLNDCRQVSVCDLSGAERFIVWAIRWRASNDETDALADSCLEDAFDRAGLRAVQPAFERFVAAACPHATTCRAADRLGCWRPPTAWMQLSEYRTPSA